MREAIAVGQPAAGEPGRLGGGSQPHGDRLETRAAFDLVKDRGQETAVIRHYQIQDRLTDERRRLAAGELARGTRREADDASGVDFQ